MATVVAALGAAAILPATAAASADQNERQPHPQSHAPATTGGGEDAEHVEHNLEGPFSKQQNAERMAAVERLASGERPQARNGSKVMKLDDEKYVEMEQAKTDKIFTILIEFGDEIDPEYGGDRGPLHNEIEEPDRSEDNTTLWKEDFDRAHFEDVYFDDGEGSLKTYYEGQSSGKYTVDGVVSDWVKVEYNEARYGNSACGANVCPTVWDAVRDGVNQWTEDQKAAGKTTEEIREELSAYDQWDRYDYDDDGDFNEPDGYLDHFQFVHAGEDASAGGGAQGDDAIWAHRWYAYGTDAGKTGPEFNLAGGTEIGDTGIWVGDYTVQPENGGLGVFAHEYAHDLGLPDLYDTTGTGESSVSYWSLMSAGSWLGKGEDAIGDHAGEMTAWDKLQLGWLDYDTAKAATKSKHTLGAQGSGVKRDGTRDDPQALLVELPEKDVTTTITKPAAGERQWWSGSGDDLRNTLTREVDLTDATTAALDLKGWWQIEEEYDFLYTEVSTDGGERWSALDGTADGAAIPRDASDTPALHGDSEGYVDLAYSLDEYAGQQIELRFHYRTDGGVSELGFAADEIILTADGETILEDGAEDGDAGWTADGFAQIRESFTKAYPQYYIAENRQYVGYDKTLKTGPYNFGNVTDEPNRVEHFPYQKGLLVWLWDTSHHDNNVGAHPGEGMILPIDAHAKPEKWADGEIMRNRNQAYDSTFSRFPSRGFTLHNEGVPAKVKGKPAKPFFDDRKGTYWYESNPTGGVKVPDTNTRISLVKQPLSGKTITVKVSPSTKR